VRKRFFAWAGLLAYETYLVHKDLKDIYVADSQTDRFVRVYP
jgi:hypothetical protein